MDTYQGARSAREQTRLFESFSYFGFEGHIKMRDPEQTFCIFEDYGFRAEAPKQIYLGRWISGSQRQAIWDYSLKRRQYISTTSMDSELALLTANLSLASLGKIFYDPFVGTGSFPIACSHFGTMSLGSDIDARMVRGKGGVDILSNFRQYGLLGKYLDSFISDLTHSPIRTARFLDGIICDPPYGVREGLKVLGNRGGGKKDVVFVDQEAVHLYEFFLCCNNSLLMDTGRMDTLLRNALIALTQCWKTFLSFQRSISLIMGDCRSGCPQPMTRTYT